MDNQNITEMNRNAWNRIATSGKNINPYDKSEKQKSLLAQFMYLLPQGGKVLDLGCGTGIPVGKRLVKAGFLLTGVDVSDEMIIQARRNVPSGNFLRMSMGEIDWDEEFDGLVSSFSMLCLPPEDFDKVAQKVVKSLKQNGLILLFLNEAVGDDRGGVQEILGQQMFSRGISEQEIRKTFEGRGMELLRVEREVVETDEYGVESTILFLMQKVNNRSSA